MAEERNVFSMPITKTHDPHLRSRSRRCSPHQLAKHAILGYDRGVECLLHVNHQNMRSLATVEEQNVFSMSISKTCDLQLQSRSKMCSLRQSPKYTILDYGRGAKHVLHSTHQIHDPRLRPRSETCSPCKSLCGPRS